MADNFVSTFTINSHGSDIDVKLKDEGARALISQEITDRSKLIKADENNNTVIETSNKLIEKSNIREINATTATENITGNKYINADNEIHSANIFDIENTLKYKNPVPVNNFYSNVPVMDRNGNIYNLLAATGKTENISKYWGTHPGIVTIGDSYGRGEGSGIVGKYTPWTTLLKNYLGLTENVNYWTNSMGGAGFNGSAPGNTFTKLLSDLSETMTEEERDTVGKILVAGGCNDSERIAPEHLTEFFNTAKLKFPNAIVYVACIGWSTNRQIATNIFNNPVTSYAKGAGLNGGVYITNSEFSLHNYTWFDGDGMHPNNEGQKHIAEMLVSGLLSGSCDNKYYLHSFDFTPNTSVCSQCDLTGYCVLDNNTTHLFFDSPEKRIEITAPLTENTPFLIGTINCDLINAAVQPNYCSIPAVGTCRYDTNKFFNPVISCWIENKGLYAAIMNVADNKTGFQDLSNVNSLFLRLSSTAFLTGFC